jgi:hypothetical protein
VPDSDGPLSPETLDTTPILSDEVSES